MREQFYHRGAGGNIAKFEHFKVGDKVIVREKSEIYKFYTGDRIIRVLYDEWLDRKYKIFTVSRVYDRGYTIDVKELEVGFVAPIIKTVTRVEDIQG